MISASCCICTIQHRLLFDAASDGVEIPSQPFTVKTGSGRLSLDELAIEYGEVTA